MGVAHRIELEDVNEAAAEIAAALTARGLTPALVDPTYSLVWVKANGVVAGIVTGYQNCEPDEYAVIDRFGDNYGGEDYCLTLNEAADAVAAYVRDGKTFKTRAKTNVLVEDRAVDDLKWNTADLSVGIDAVLGDEASELRGDAFRGDLDTMDWERAEVYVRIAPGPCLYGSAEVEIARAPVFEDDEGEESYTAKRNAALASALDFVVVLSANAIRDKGEFDNEQEVEAVVAAVEAAVDAWAGGGNDRGLRLSVDLGNADEGCDDGEIAVTVSFGDRAIFKDDADELRDALEELVRDAIAQAIENRNNR